MLAMLIAYHMAYAENKRVGILSLEMDATENLKRFWTHLSNKNIGFTPGFYQHNFEDRFKEVWSDEETRKNFDQVEGGLLRNIPVFYLKPKDINVNEMKKYFSLFKEKYKCDVILLDHLLLVTDNKEERLIVKDISNFMKTFAAQNNIITIGVSQMNRGADINKLDNVNTVDEMSGGRSIEQAASQILSISQLSKDKLTSKNNPMLNISIDPTVRKMTLLKSRHSKSNTSFYVNFLGDQSTFKQIMPDNWDDVVTSNYKKSFIYSEFDG